ncbi:MAG: 3-deoxy-8-phosphooctulonate synthase [bacterium]
MKTREITINKVKIGGLNPLVLVAGPCVIESERIFFLCAEKLVGIVERLKIPFIFKASYDKANRSSIDSYRGPGFKKGLEFLDRLKKKFKIPVTSDIHCRNEIKEASEVLDLLQIPALLSRQTDFIVESAKTMRPVNIKKGQFLSPWEMKNIVSKVESTGNRNIILTERGSSFGYNNLVADMRSLPYLRQLGYPVIFDATHSVQLPGGLGKSSSGQREFVPYLAKSSVGCGCDGIFMEVHISPDKALCDGPNMLAIKDLPVLLEELMAIDELKRKRFSR